MREIMRDGRAARAVLMLAAVTTAVTSTFLVGLSGSAASPAGIIRGTGGYGGYGYSHSATPTHSRSPRGGGDTGSPSASPSSPGASASTFSVSSSASPSGSASSSTSVRPSGSVDTRGFSETPSPGPSGNLPTTGDGTAGHVLLGTLTVTGGLVLAGLSWLWTRRRRARGL